MPARKRAVQTCPYMGFHPMDTCGFFVHLRPQGNVRWPTPDTPSSSWNIKLTWPDFVSFFWPGTRESRWYYLPHTPNTRAKPYLFRQPQPIPWPDRRLLKSEVGFWFPLTRWPRRSERGSLRYRDHTWPYCATIGSELELSHHLSARCLLFEFYVVTHYLSQYESITVTTAISQFCSFLKGRGRYMKSDTSMPVNYRPLVQAKRSYYSAMTSVYTGKAYAREYILYI